MLSRDQVKLKLKNICQFNGSLVTLTNINLEE